MNWKFQIGKLLSACENLIIKSKSSFIKNNFPFGRNWIFDLKRILSEDPIHIIDAGANIGEVSKELAYYFPSANISSFEPISETYKKLINNTRLIKNINQQPFALGEHEESIEIYLNPENTINSIKSSYLDDHNSLGKEVINIKRLDQFCKYNNIQHINILKIDVEGFEFEVLDGCGNMLHNQIDCILLEVGYEREETKVHFSDVEIYLEKYNYQLCGIYEIMRNLNNKKKIAYSNNLYIKKELLKN